MKELSENKEVSESPKPESENYKKIKPENERNPDASRQYIDNLFCKEIKRDMIETEIKKTTKSESVTTEKLDMKIRIEKTGLLPRTGGEWSGKPGDSEWTPNSEVEPGDRNGTNLEQKTWGQIKEEYGFESIPFNDGEPDFSEVSKGEVEIDDFTDDRDSNFAQADEKLAEQRGCTPEEVAKWREEHRYTWHECKDCKTMQKVPSEVHGNVPHSGGVSEYKSQQKSA